MNRISLAFAVLIALVFAGLEARAERVMSGAMDICQAVDGGDTSQIGNTQVCCATETTEYDDGMVIYGERYCVMCVTGTDDCERQEVAKSTNDTIRTLNKALATKTKKAPAAGN